MLSVRKRKLDANGLGQAGTGELLADRNGNAIYYAAHVNAKYYNWVRDNMLYKKSVLSKLQPTDPASTFPVETVELKTSWAIAEAKGRSYIPNASARFFTTTATIGPPTVKSDSGVPVWSEDMSRSFQATLALTGLHVVGRVRGHPEFIWATFEHRDLAPDCAALTDSAVVLKLPATGGTGHPWLIYEPGTPASKCNIGLDPSVPPPPIAATPVCRKNPWGGGNTTNKANIQELNHSVTSQLPAGSIWRNYILIGALWTDGTLPASSGNEKGSVDLANTTMESFSQSANCFGCHNVLPDARAPHNLEVSLSHLLQLAQKDASHPSALAAIAPTFQQVKDKCFTPSAEVQKKLGLKPDSWQQCMLDAVGIDIWNEAIVKKNMDKINTEIMSNLMPPRMSGGPLPQESKAVWSGWYQAQAAERR